MRGKTVERVASLLCALLIVVVGPHHARAIGDLNDRDPDARVLGIGGALSVLLMNTVVDSPAQAGWFAEVGETHLFEVPGLAMNYLDVGVRYGPIGLIVGAAQLSSPVGGERRVSAEPFLWRRGRWVISGVVSLHAVSFSGRRMARLVSLGSRMSASVTRTLDIGYTIENYRVSGEPFPGANTALHIVFHPGNRAIGVACARLDRYGNVSAGVASRVRFGRRLETSVGYDDASEAFAGLVTVRLSQLGIIFGAEVHPVLGVSKSVSVRWGQ